MRKSVIEVALLLFSVSTFVLGQILYIDFENRWILATISSEAAMFCPMKRRLRLFSVLFPDYNRKIPHTMLVFPIITGKIDSFSLFY